MTTLTRLTRTAAISLATALAVTACGGETEVTLDPQDADTTGTTDERIGGDDGDAQTERDDGGEASIPELTAVPFPDAPRELTDTEQMLMFEPGPYAGDAYDKDAVLEAVQAMDPGTPQEWEAAILSQIHGDYSEDVKLTMQFDPVIGDNPDSPEEQDVDEEQTVGTNHFALVLDASGSMAEASDTGTRMEEATAALVDFVGTLPAGSTASLRIYGHEGDNTSAGKDESCGSSEVVFEGPVDAGAFTDAVEQVSPVGWTPLARAIEDGAGDIPEDATDAIMYVVTDGLETCGGDPVAAAEDVATGGLEPIINVVGYQTGDADQEQLRAIAEAGNGEFAEVGSKADLDTYWREEYERMMRAWDEWQGEALRQINEQGGENLATADEIGGRLMTTADTEQAQGLELADALGDLGLEYSDASQVWQAFYERGQEAWDYGYSTQQANWSASYGQQQDRWREAYDTGQEKWSEYYSKSQG